ncbi:OmpA family protein [Lysobacter sp. SG-8]|uniref:OmpA family protein n=1 Tax=Marilutibacter penaei TaxID=2759900 RepID=A0A7W3U4D0_9GAMM|nr:OmpA family protein [Lysobacter penaei]MBB1088703.1 OmpA family protein [Lysobacter penaei]
MRWTSAILSIDRRSSGRHLEVNERLSLALGRSLAVVLLAGALAACGSDQGADAEAPTGDGTAEPGPSPVVEPRQEAADIAAGAAPGDAPFTIEDVPVSAVPLGAFPYFSIPDGYKEAAPRNVSRLDFGQAAFWTGDRFERVEGKVYATGIRVDRDSGKQFSPLEVARNLEHVVKQAGGVEVFSGETPTEVRNDPSIEALMKPYHAEARCWAHAPIQTFVIRREGATIWVRTCQAQNYAGLIVAEEEAFVSTSRLLPADALKQKLDADGRVALQIHFATDKADILPESQPQIAQILELLEQHPSLELAVNGHTDNTGDAEHNQALSEARAGAVVTALASKGIEAARLQAQGFGQSQPVADNSTEVGKAANRRVELVRR